MPGTFEIKKRIAGQFVFDLRTSNGKIIVTSKPHKTRTAVMAATLEARTIAANAEVEDLCKRQ